MNQDNNQHTSPKVDPKINAKAKEHYEKRYSQKYSFVSFEEKKQYKIMMLYNFFLNHSKKLFTLSGIILLSVFYLTYQYFTLVNQNYKNSITMSQYMQNQEEKHLNQIIERGNIFNSSPYYYLAKLILFIENSTSATEEDIKSLKKLHLFSLIQSLLDSDKKIHNNHKIESLIAEAKYINSIKSESKMPTLNPDMLKKNKELNASQMRMIISQIGDERSLPEHSLDLD